MAIRTKIIPAIDIFSCTDVEGGFAGVPHWNIRFSAKAGRRLPAQFDLTDLMGCGIYGIVWQLNQAQPGTLGYVGSFKGSGRKRGAKTVSFVGDVRERHWKHLATQSGRGPMFLNRSVLEVLTTEFGPKHAMVKGIRAGTGEVFSAKGKPLGAYGRLAFAAKHWDYFSTATPEQILGSATLVYTRLTQLPPGISAAEAARRIDALEISLIDRLQPPCNTTHRNYDVEPTVLNANEVAALFQSRFEQQFAANAAA